MLNKKLFFTIILTLATFLTPNYIAAAIDFDDPSNIASQIWDVVRDDLLKPAGIVVADKVLSKMSDDVVNWSNNGFDGQPGFLNNYDDFLKGVEFDAISSAFNLASGIAQQTQNNSNKASDLAFSTCSAEAYRENESSLDFLTEPQSDYDLEYALVQCKIEVSTNASVKKYNDCFQKNDQAAKDYSNNIMTSSASPKFDQDYPDWVNQNDDTKFEWRNDAAGFYEFMYKRNQCFNTLRQSNVAGDTAVIARANHELRESGKVTSSRTVAQTVADTGTEKLNDKRFEQLTRGGGDLTLALLGSQGRKEDFKTDITAGGWDGILSLTGEGSTDLALTTTARILVGDQAQKRQAVEEAVIQLPTKILDKKICVKYKRNPETNERTEECEREITGTPGDVVADLTKQALNADSAKAESFGGDLVTMLISSLGSTVDKLTSQGLGKLSTAAGNAFFAPESTETLVQGSSNNGDFQSRYNVSGIEPITSTSLLASNITENDQGTIARKNIDSSFIGGPEDLDPQATIGSGPQVVIDLKENLEQNISFIEDEADYFDKAQKVLKNSKSTAIELDRCLPGPDYNWEDRYEDEFDSFGDDPNSQKNRLGLIETREMVNDPLVNIPGSIKIRETFNNIIGLSKRETGQLKQRKDDLDNTLRSLRFVKDEIENQHNRIKTNLQRESSILFKDQWDALVWYSPEEIAEMEPEEIAEIKSNELTQAQKINAVTNAVIGFNRADGTQSAGYLLLRTSEGETVESLIQSNPDKARDAVIAMAWDMWRDGTDKQTKTDLRYSYYVTQNSLSNEQFIARARSNFIRIDIASADSEKLLADCLVLKSFALGTPASEIGNKTRGKTNLKSSVEVASLNTLLFAINPYLLIGKMIYVSSSGSFAFIEPENTKNNNEIKTFLENQYTILNDTDPNTESLFSTQHLISPGAITESILGFDDTIMETVQVQTSAGTDIDAPKFEEQSLPQSRAYFQSNYPDYGFKSIQKNSYEIIDLWKKDRFLSTFNRARGVRSVLFCRNPRIADLNRSRGLGGDSKNDDQPECIRSAWPIAKNLDYEVLFAEISN